MAKMRIEIGTGGELRPGELEVTVTMRGDPNAVTKALIHGLPPDSLQELHAAIAAEMERRDDGGGPGGVPQS